MSSESNKATVRRVFEDVWNRGNGELVDRFVASDAVDHHDPDVVDVPAHVKETIVAYRRAFPDLRFTVDDLIAEGEKVARRLTLSGTNCGPFNDLPPTGRRVAVEHIHVFRLAGGRVVAHWAAMDTLGMLQQLGVVPESLLAAA